MHLPALRRADQFDRWVAAICRNEARALARRRPQITEETATEDAPTGGDEIGEAVKAALSQLPSEAREVIYLRFYDGLSYDQISAVLGISEQAHRQLTQLGEKLDPDDPVTTMADALMPALLKVLTIKTVQQAHAHATRAAVDICLHRATTGRLPATLPPGLPKDPFSGRDFQYERTASGFVLRCQGKDLDKDTIHESALTVK